VSGRKGKVKSDSADFAREGPAVFRIELGERIRFLLDQFATRVEAAEIAAVTPEHLASYIAGRAKPPFELIARLARAKGISLDWLATGEGVSSAEEAEPEGFVPIAFHADGESRYGAEESADAPFAFSRAWLRTEVKAPEDKLRVVIHRGNANEPAIRDGDAMLVDISVDRIAEDAFYVFARDGRLQAKFVETYIDGRVALKSRNPDFETQLLTADDAARLNVFGRVRWRGGTLP
jgi:phage repressor protein C with HTH and peptisase S24 domain